jgi:S-adenosylmethionine:diacylglycerol 3-amino-3-carboxypropyl transferase
VRINVDFVDQVASTFPGCISATVRRITDGTGVFSYLRWESAEQLAAMQRPQRVDVPGQPVGKRPTGASVHRRRAPARGRLCAGLNESRLACEYDRLDAVAQAELHQHAGVVSLIVASPSTTSAAISQLVSPRVRSARRHEWTARFHPGGRR